MTTTQKTKIGIALELVARDEHCPQDQKEAAIDMLLCADQAMNDAPDLTVLERLKALADAVASQGVYLSRLPRHEAARAERLIRTHTVDCPLRNGISGRYAALYPYRWPIVVLVAVLIMSPYAGPVIGRFLERHMDAAATEMVRGK